jgi:hypothetical protein
MGVITRASTTNLLYGRLASSCSYSNMWKMKKNLVEKKQQSLSSNDTHPFAIMPSVIILLLQNYLKWKEYGNFLNCSRKLFLEIKKESATYPLTSEMSRKFCSDNDFRALVLSKIQNFGKQLSLKFGTGEWFFSTNPSVFRNLAFGSIFVLKLKWDNRNNELNCNDYFRFIDSLNINESESMESLPFIINDKRLKNLSLRHCPRLISLLGISSSLSTLCIIIIDDCYNLRDLSCLKNVPDISISNCGITDYDIASFGENQRRLSLSTCKFLTNVSHLGNIPYLKLEKCELIENIEGLKNNSEVIISKCSTRLYGYCSLRNATRLVLSDCNLQSTAAFSPHPNLRSIEFLNCRELTDISSLEQAKILKVIKVSTCAVTNDAIIAVRHVPTIFLYYCQSVTDFSGLGENKKFVSINNCKAVNDFSSLFSVEKVFIYQSSTLKDVSVFCDSCFVKVVSCNCLLAQQSLSFLSVLKLYHCHSVEELYALTGLNTSIWKGVAI